MVLKFNFGFCFVVYFKFGIKLELNMKARALNVSPSKNNYGNSIPSCNKRTTRRQGNVIRQLD